MRPNPKQRITLPGRCALLALALTPTACTDRITGPEAVAMLRTLEQPYATDSAGYEIRFLEDLGNWSGLIRQLDRAVAILPATDVIRDGRSIRYSAMVVERLMEPSIGLAPHAACFTPRRSLLLWRPGELDAIVVMGGDYTQRVRPWPDDCAGTPGPQPFAWAGRIVNASTPQEQRMWWRSSDGIGDISPGVDTGPCQFMHPREAQYLLAEHGITCLMTRHQVHFDVRMASLPHDRRGNAGAPGFSWRLPPLELTGVRFTVDCTLEAAKPGCHPYLSSRDVDGSDATGLTFAPEEDGRPRKR